MKKVLALLTAFVLLSSGVAVAHQPVVLLNSDTTAAKGPLLVDGTVSFAVRAAFKKAGEKKAFRAQLKEGDALEVQYLIVDKKPENALKSSQLPSVVITGPGGFKTTMKIDERTNFYEPYGGTNYFYLARYSAPAKAGIYNFLITAKAKSEITLAVGQQEIKGEVVRGPYVAPTPTPTPTPTTTPTPTPTTTPTPTPINTNVVTDATRFIQSLINDTPITNTKNKTKIVMHVEAGKNGKFPAIAEEALTIALNFYASLGMALPQDSINVILGRTQGWMKEKADTYAPGCVSSTYIFDTSASLCAYPNRAAVSSRLPRAITYNGAAPDDIDLANEEEILRYTNKKVVDSFAGAIPHEAHHAWQDGSYGNANDIPKWLWEGGASIFGEMIYARMQSPTQSYLSFDPGFAGWDKSVCKGPIETMKPVCEYTQGIVVMEYFLYKLGVESYVRLITQGNNVAFPVRFENATKVSLLSFYADVNKYLTLKGWNY